MPDWTRVELEAEFVSHGFQSLESEGARVKGFSQRAIEEIISEHQFPFREINELIVPGEWTDGLGKISQVTSQDGTVLTPCKRDELQDRYGRADQAGIPEYYYPFQQNRIYTYPMSTEPLSVVHYSLACWIEDDGARVQSTTQDAAKPVIPAQFRDVALLLMIVYGKEDVSDWEAAAVQRTRYEERLNDMQEALVPRQVDEADYIRNTTEMV